MTQHHTNSKLNKYICRRNIKNYTNTAPWNNPSAWSDKVSWVTKYLDDIFHKRIIITHCKNLCKGDILIDDRNKNGTSEFEGEWIQFGSERYPDWNAVLNYLIPEED